jgi:hypothetical protein
MIKELTEKEFKSTMAGGMVDITQTVDPVADIWPYVEELTEKRIVLDYVYEKQLIETVYEDSFHHVRLPTDDKNNFVVVIVDVIAKNVMGHFCLNLNREYGQI